MRLAVDSNRTLLETKVNKAFELGLKGETANALKAQMAMWKASDAAAIEGQMKLGGLLKAEASKASGRITSYNVCYTKLLRLSPASRWSHECNSAWSKGADPSLS